MDHIIGQRKQLKTPFGPLVIKPNTIIVVTGMLFKKQNEA